MHQKDLELFAARTPLGIIGKKMPTIFHLSSFGIIKKKLHHVDAGIINQIFWGWSCSINHACTPQLHDPWFGHVWMFRTRIYVSVTWMLPGSMFNWVSLVISTPSPFYGHFGDAALAAWWNDAPLHTEDVKTKKVGTSMSKNGPLQEK